MGGVLEGVRVLDFEKIIAQVCPASGAALGLPRFPFSSRASAKIFPNSWCVKSVSLRKCFMGNEEK